MKSNYSLLCLLAGIFLVFSLTGCQHTIEDQDGPPLASIDINKIHNAVPKVEPKSRYGNPESYEVYGERYTIMKTNHQFHERGLASWYGTKFHGKRTSSGEPYDLSAMTAAHRRLPLPTYLKVTNLENGRQVIVKVNDRGPFKENRILDLSYAAALKLDITRKGTGLVEIEAINPEEPNLKSKTTLKAPPVTPITPLKSNKKMNTHLLYLQVGAYTNAQTAMTVKKHLQTLIQKPINIVETKEKTKTIFRVNVGPIKHTEESDQLYRTLKKAGYRNPWLVVEDI